MEAAPRITIRKPKKILPFWQRVPSFFVFPLQPAALIRILALSALVALAGQATSPGSIMVAFGGLSLLAWIFLLRFACRVLSETSFGRLSLSDYSELPDESLAYLPFKLFFLYAIPGMLVGLVMSLFGPAMGVLANFAVMLALPAAIMAMVVSRSLLTGLNPSSAWSVISAVGKPYLLLCIFLYFLSSAQMLVIALIAKSMLLPLFERFMALNVEMRGLDPSTEADRFIAIGEALHQLFIEARPKLTGAFFLIQAVMFYFTLIGFNMLGYVLYQYHAELGLEIDEQAGANEQASPQEAQGAEIARLIAEGQATQALELAYEAQRLDPENLPAQERYNKLLHLTGKDERLLNHSEKLIAQQLRQEQPASALETLLRCRERHPDYLPEDASAIVKLAQTARATGDARFAIALLNGFDRKFRNHALVPEVYYLCGLILCEDLRKDEMADRFFATLCSRHPEHARVEDARRLREIIARMKEQQLATAKG